MPDLQFLQSSHMRHIQGGRKVSHYYQMIKKSY